MTIAVATANAREKVAEYLVGIPMWVSLHTDQPAAVDPLSTVIRMPDEEMALVTWSRQGAVLSNANTLQWNGMPSLTTVRFAAISADPTGTEMLFYAELDTQDPTELVSFRSVVLSPGELRIAIV
jgi:hypothetical protein